MEWLVHSVMAAAGLAGAAISARQQYDVQRAQQDAQLNVFQPYMGRPGAPATPKSNCRNCGGPRSATACPYCGTSY